MCYILKSLNSRHTIIIGVIQIIAGILTSALTAGVKAYYTLHYKVTLNTLVLVCGNWIGGIVLFGGVLVLIAGIKPYFSLLIRYTQ